ncbi:MAG: DUF881 domain-containing protein [Clostridia bacterium]|nr:DUF881 domain-containing protein [Clostridia bacterium]
MENHAGAKRFPGYIALVAICFLLGFGLTLQIKSVYKNKSVVVDTEMARADQLQKTINDQKDQNDALVKQVQSLQKTVSDYRDQAAKSGDADKTLNDQLTNAEILAGISAVQGPGVTITMNDSKVSASSGTDASAFVIHDIDILQVLNELRDAGAEALSLNGERILATSEVRCAGNVVSVNDNRYAAPFIISAIGKPDQLKSALLMRDGIVDVLSQWGIEVDVATSAKIVINGYSGTPQFNYAKPAKGGD